jgi:hypothetical protein
MNSIFYRKFQRLSGWQVISHIRTFLEKHGEPLTKEQWRLLLEDWGMASGNCGDLNLPFQAYTWEAVKYNGKPLVRLTLPFFIVFAIIMTLIVRPIHWTLTGLWWFGDQQSKVESFINKWWINMFGE